MRKTWEIYDSVLPISICFGDEKWPRSTFAESQHLLFLSSASAAPGSTNPLSEIPMHMFAEMIEMFLRRCSFVWRGMAPFCETIDSSCRPQRPMIGFLSTLIFSEPRDTNSVPLLQAYLGSYLLLDTMLSIRQTQRQITCVQPQELQKRNAVAGSN